MTTDTLEEVTTQKGVTKNNEPRLDTTFGDIMRIEIRGNWQNFELATLLSVIEDVYQLSFALTAYSNLKHTDLNNPISQINYRDIQSKLDFCLFKKSEINTLFELHNKLKNKTLKFYDKTDLYSFNFSQKEYFFRVIRLKYNSPGSIDLFGVGKILELIKDFVKGIINFYEDRKEKKVKIEILEEDLKKMKIENAQRLLVLAKKMNCDNITLTELNDFIQMRQDKLFFLVESNQIKDIKIIDKEVELEK